MITDEKNPLLDDELQNFREEKKRAFLRTRISELAESARSFALILADFTSHFYEYYTKPGALYIKKIEDLQTTRNALGIDLATLQFIVGFELSLKLRNDVRNYMGILNHDLQSLLHSISYGYENNLKILENINENYRLIQNIINDERDRLIDAIEINFPDEIIENIYRNKLASCKDVTEAYQFLKKFRQISKQYKRVTESDIMKSFFHCLFQRKAIDGQIISPFQQAILYGYFELLDYFSADSSVFTESKNDNQNSFLYFSLRNAAPSKSIQWLINHGVKFDLDDLDFIGLIATNECFGFFLPYYLNEAKFPKLSTPEKAKKLYLLSVRGAWRLLAYGIDASWYEKRRFTYEQNMLALLKLAEYSFGDISNFNRCTEGEFDWLDVNILIIHFNTTYPINSEGNNFLHFLAKDYNHFLNFLALVSLYNFPDPSIKNKFDELLLSRNLSGKDPLHIALFSINRLEDFIKLKKYIKNFDLYKDIANLSLRRPDQNGRIPLHYFMEDGLIYTSKFYFYELSHSFYSKITEERFLTEYTSSCIAVQDSLGYTPLHLDVMRRWKTEDNIRGFGLLIDKLNLRLVEHPLTGQNESLLLLAAKAGNRDLVKYFLSETRLDASIRDKSGKSAIDYIDKEDQELLDAFKRISSPELSRIKSKYETYKHTLFGKISRTKGSDRILRKISYSSLKTRFEIAEEYVARKPDKKLTEILQDEIPSLKK